MTPAQDATALADRFHAVLRERTKIVSRQDTDGLLALLSEHGLEVCSQERLVELAALRATSQTPDAGLRTALERIARYPFDEPNSNDAIIVTDLALHALRSTPSVSAGPQAPIWACVKCGWSGTDPDSSRHNDHGHFYTAPACKKCGHYFSAEEFPASAGLQAQADGVATIARIIEKNAEIGIPWEGPSITNAYAVARLILAAHPQPQIDQLKTQIRHWREECGKLHARLAQPQQADGRGDSATDLSSDLEKVQAELDEATSEIERLKALLASSEGRGALLGAVERAMRENPYTTYSFAAQNDAVERKRAEKYVRMIARVVVSALQSPETDSAPAVGAHQRGDAT